VIKIKQLPITLVERFEAITPVNHVKYLIVGTLKNFCHRTYDVVFLFIHDIANFMWMMVILTYVKVKYIQRRIHTD